MNEVETLLTHSFDEIKRGGLIVELLRLTQKYLGLPVTDCEKEHLKYYQSLQKIKLKPMEKVKSNLLDKKYILRGTSLLYYNNTHFNNDTLTDKIAEKAVEKFPALIGIFLTEKEKNVLKAKAGAMVSIDEAEKAVNDEAIEKTVNALIESGDLEGAKVEAEKLVDEEKKAEIFETLDAAIANALNDKDPEKPKDPEKAKAKAKKPGTK